jgi:hypothetical protein
MNRLRALRVLLGVRERRGKALDDAVTEALRVHEAALATEREAGTRQQAAQQREAGARARLSDMLEPGRSFDAVSLEARRCQVEIMVGQVAEARQDTERCAADTARCQDLVRQRRADVARNRQKIGTLHDDIARLLAERQRAADDDQDEEAEEGAISRMIAATRQAAEAAELAAGAGS